MLRLVRSLFPGAGRFKRGNPTTTAAHKVVQGVSGLGYSGSAHPPVAAVAYNELLIAIEATQVIWRPSREGDETAGPIVRVATLGSWTWTNRADARAKVASKYPELSSREYARAAALIEAQIGKRNINAFRRGRYLDRIEREEKAFWEGRRV